MADPQPAATVSPVPTGPVQPATLPADDGFERVSRDELQTLRRNSEKVRGMEGFYQEANRRGFKKPEDFGQYDRFSGVLKKRGMTMEQVQQLLDSEPEQTAPEQGEAMTPAALEKFLTDKGYVNKTALDEREALIGAKFSHKEAMASEQTLVEKYVTELTGEKATPFEKATIKAMLRGMAEEKRGLYPDGHPLARSELAAHNEKSLTGIVAEIKKMRGDAEGDALAQLGDKALLGSKHSTPAGSSGHTTTTPPKKDDTMRPGGKPSVAVIEAAYKKKVAARGGGPVSSMGG